MSLVQLMRTPPNWVRTMFACLVLVFLLDTMAHAGHSHDGTVSGSQAKSHLCGYCTGLGGMVDAPVPLQSVVAQSAPQFVVSFPPDLMLVRELPLASRSRAPPSF